MGNMAPSDEPDAAARLIGTWKIDTVVSEIVDQNGQATFHPAAWHGYITMTAAHRTIVFQTAKDRPTPDNDEEYVYSFCSMIAYSGKHEIAGNRIVINVDIAWNENFSGIDQIWFYRFEGDRLILEDTLQQYLDVPGCMIRVIWTCIKDCQNMH